MNQLATFFFLLSCFAFSTCAHARTWEDSTGRYTVEAEFVGEKNGIVTLKRANGKVLSLPISKLSAADQRFVAEAKKALQKNKLPKEPETTKPKAPASNGQLSLDEHTISFDTTGSIVLRGRGIQLITVIVNIVGEQASEAVHFRDLVVTKAIGDGEPLMRVNRWARELTDEDIESKEIHRGELSHLSPKDGFRGRINFKLPKGLQSITLAGSVKLELPQKVFKFSMDSYDEQPISSPEFGAGAAFQRTGERSFRLTVTQKPDDLIVHVVDVDGNALQAPGGYKRSPEKTIYLDYKVLGKASLKGGEVRMSFGPRSTVEVPFSVENLKPSFPTAKKKKPTR